MAKLLLLTGLLLAGVHAAIKIKPNRGKPFTQPDLNAWPNPSTERDENGKGWIDPKNKDKNGKGLGYVSCDDDIGWKPLDISDKDSVDVNTYLQSPAGIHCHCPRSGRWNGKMTNGTWYWDYGAGDWDVTPGVNGHPAVVAGRGVMSATAIWEFWSTNGNGEKVSGIDTTEDLVKKGPQPSERFWVSQEVTIWGQPETGAMWIPDNGEFQSSKKFAELNDQGKVMLAEDGKTILYKGSSISLVYECQTLYTDTLAPDRRDQGCASGSCGASEASEKNSDTSSKRSLDAQDAQNSKTEVTGGDTPGPAPPPTPTPPAPTEQFPHKMAWFMFLTASSGPGAGKGGQKDQNLQYQTCDDVNAGAQTCGERREPTSPGYTWLPGVNTCPNSFKTPYQGYDAGNFMNKPLCPDCIPSTAYDGSDGGGILKDSKHPEIGQQSANDLHSGLPPCATKRDPKQLDADDKPWENDYFSMCDFPFVASAMAMPINGLYASDEARTFHGNGTITAGPPQDGIGGQNQAHIDAKSRAPGE